MIPYHVAKKRYRGWQLYYYNDEGKFNCRKINILQVIYWWYKIKRIKKVTIV